MRKPIIMAALLSTLLLSSCGTTSLGTQGTGLLSGANAGTTGSAVSALGSVLTNLLGGSSAVTASDLQGTWTYRKADCVFETQNLLLKAGGEMAAAKIESQLENQLGKVGITPRRLLLHVQQRRHLCSHHRSVQSHGQLHAQY